MCTCETFTRHSQVHGEEQKKKKVLGLLKVNFKSIVGGGHRIFVYIMIAFQKLFGKPWFTGKTYVKQTFIYQGCHFTWKNLEFRKF